MVFHFTTVVWGREYVQFFLNATLPSQLSEGNLPAFFGLNARYTIYTTIEDSRTIAASPFFKELSRHVETEITFIDYLSQFEKYVRMTLCHKRAIMDATLSGATLLFLPPDVIFATGSFDNLLKIIQTGTRAIMLFVPRVRRRSFMGPLLEMASSPHGGPLAIPPRDLVRLALAHLHPVANSLFIDSAQASPWPSQLYFRIPDEGILAHCFHLHPIMVNPLSHNLSFSISIDGDYLLASCPDSREITVVTDSDLIAAVEPCLDSYAPPPTPRIFHIPEIAAWAQTNANPHHRYFFTHPIRFHDREPGPLWRRTELQTGIYADCILSSLRSP
jgi:hypothetical protein